VRGHAKFSCVHSDRYASLNAGAVTSYLLKIANTKKGGYSTIPLEVLVPEIMGELTEARGRSSVLPTPTYAAPPAFYGGQPSAGIPPHYGHRMVCYDRSYHRGLQ
jgi:hypothetical protein